MLAIDAAIQHSQFKNRKIFEKLQVIIAEQLGIEPNQVSLASNFANHLGADSLDMLELFMVLEKAFDIPINDEVAKNILTVQKLVNYINQCHLR
ncbi:MAG: acyl carrier protein [Scytonema sp. RU_4_4]|nr:acyl carrier protein [Scytonema sp. RU_4_4]